MTKRRSRWCRYALFVRVVPGHIADIDWYAFVHNGPSDCAKQGRQLFIDERGTSGDLLKYGFAASAAKPNVAWLKPPYSPIRHLDHATDLEFGSVLIPERLVGNQVGC